ncbi:MAG: hypothetical protein KTR32_17675 [Granulosicoccus sp.]|nr:hypothetical protein [Granulosicoccus sp.]
MASANANRGKTHPEKMRTELPAGCAIALICLRNRDAQARNSTTSPVVFDCGIEQQRLDWVWTGSGLGLDSGWMLG